MSQEEEKELIEAGEVCRKFMAWNLSTPEADTNPENLGVKAMLAAVLTKNDSAESESH